MNVKKPSHTDKKILKSLLKKEGIINIPMKKKEWHISINYQPNIITILTAYGYSIDHEQLIICVYIPRNLKVTL